MMSNPEHVAIVALGPSSTSFIRYAEGAGGSKAYCDEVWGINMNGGVLQCDRIFHMDDLKVQELRVEYGSGMSEKLKGMLAWMKEHPGPIYTSRAYPDYPGSVDFPLEDVIRSCGTPYFNNTAPYAIAMAIHLKVKMLSLFGFDYTYPDIAAAEKGRGCCEYWVGRAHERGIQLFVTPDSTLLDTCMPAAAKFYGYDMVDLIVEIKDGDVKVDKKPRYKLRDKTIAEIERNYTHDLWTVRSEHQVHGGEALDRLLEYDDIKTVLDVGSGAGRQAKIMSDAGKKVTTIVFAEHRNLTSTLRITAPGEELKPGDVIEKHYEGDFMDTLIECPDGGFDAIWVSHVLEHQLNVNSFLKRCFNLLREDGILAITVPPAKDEVVGGHMTVWNTGLIIYNLILAGFDCRNARVSGKYTHLQNQEPYNISVIVRKQAVELPALVRDDGDIGKLQDFFPIPVVHGFDGNLPPAGW